MNQIIATTIEKKKSKQQTMSDIIDELQQKNIFSPNNAEMMHSQFDCLQLAIFRDTKNNVTCAHC